MRLSTDLSCALFNQPSPSTCLAAALSQTKTVASPKAVAARGVAAQAAAVDVGSKLRDLPEYYKQIRKNDGSMMSLSSVVEGASKTLVLFFYPKSFTPGCTKEACRFRDEYDAFTSAGAEVIGISSDAYSVQQEFKDKHRLPFVVLSHEGDVVRKGFGVPAAAFGMIKGRMTYVIDKTGVCRMAFNSATDMDAHITQALKVVKGLQA